ncbi:hypothetical protein CSUI_007448, partial [Cystoisospora suis]
FFELHLQFLHFLFVSSSGSLLSHLQLPDFLLHRLDLRLQLREGKNVQCAAPPPAAAAPASARQHAYVACGTDNQTKRRLRKKSCAGMLQQGLGLDFCWKEEPPRRCSASCLLLPPVTDYVSSLRLLEPQQRPDRQTFFEWPVVAVPRVLYFFFTSITCYKEILPTDQSV